MWSWIKSSIEKTIVNLLLTAYWYYNYGMVRLEMLLGRNMKKIIYEPELPQWNCVCTVDNDRLFEYYTYEPTLNVTPGKLCIRKEDRRYLCVSEYGNDANIAGTPNNTRFLNVQYVHPDMKAPIKLTLDIKYIRNGNEIFSQLFVRRLLEHQYNSNEYIFDNNYEIHLMDQSINKVEIKSNQYLKFDDLQYKCGYTII